MSSHFVVGERVSLVDHPTTRGYVAEINPILVDKSHKNTFTVRVIWETIPELLISALGVDDGVWHQAWQLRPRPENTSPDYETMRSTNG